jgi:hypothetical protein
MGCILIVYRVYKGSDLASAADIDKRFGFRVLSTPLQPSPSWRV